MSDTVTANLPSADFDRTEEFYAKLGFSASWKSAEWMILQRGPLLIEFFPFALDPEKSNFSACVRVDDLDALYTAFGVAGLPADTRAIPRLTPPGVISGLRMFALIDPDGSLLRCIENPAGG